MAAGYAIIGESKAMHAGALVRGDKRFATSASQRYMSLPAELTIQVEMLRLPKDQLSSQQRKLNRDIDWFESIPLAKKDAPLTQEQQEKSRQAFIRSWLLVNTRTFYWDYPVPDRTLSQAPHTVAKNRELSKRVANAPRWSSDDCALSSISLIMQTRM